jgi:hypothetical protein
MKKVIFSAIAMIAFVGSSMAINIAEREVLLTDSEVTQIAEMDVSVVVAKDCGVAKFSAYNDAKSAGFTHEQATGMAWNVYFFCMSENSKKVTSIQP